MFFEGNETLLPPDLTLEERRIVTEVAHIYGARLYGPPENANIRALYDQALLDGVGDNMVTKVQEDAMSSAVTRSYQTAEEVADVSGEKKRTFIWRGLGRSALSVAESGYDFHFSEPAFARVGIEVAEAKHSEANLTPGIAQVFISPRMSETDAPGDIAEKEHLANEDAIRIGKAVVDEQGNVIGRQMESLLVRDIPLSSWVDMLRDPNNIFGRSFEVDDPESALSVMKLFEQMDLPEARLPEGPVSLVAEVSKYIKDSEMKNSVLAQLEDFRQDQTVLRNEASNTTAEWLNFDVNLAESLHQNQMQDVVYNFLIGHQSQWPQDVWGELQRVTKSDGTYGMSWKLAAKLEQAWQKIHLGAAAIAVGDKRATNKMDQGTLQRLQTNIAYIRMLEANGIPQAEINRLSSQHYREVATSGVEPGGGCNGRNTFSFSDNPDGVTDGLAIPNAKADGNTQSKGQESADEKLGKKKKGYCRIPGCEYQKEKTEVGGCDVCLKSCQPLFDQGFNSDQIEAMYASTYQQEDEGRRPKLRFWGELVGVE